ncbi:MAG: methyltransferase domain-containing protein [Raineya sp.]|nr:class I SAM-dependent methyltransferase [Raineya sp.]MDW8295251.1 methyltransferase domain-containing protein [Raineya sp.]
MKKMNFLLITLLIIFSFACKETPPITQKTANHKDTFFRQARIFFNADFLRKEIQKLGINEREIVEFCRVVDDAALRSKFAAAVFSQKTYNKTPAKEEFWAAIRFNLPRFVETIMLLKEPEQKTFMDIGSGNGEKLFTALCLGFEKAYGLEYSPQSVAESKENLKNFSQEIEITQGDALQIEGSFFQKADFLYMYSPIKDNQLAAKLFKRVLDNMKDGAIFLEVRCVYIDEVRKLTRLNFPPLKSWIAVKKQDGKFYYKNIIDQSYNYTNTDTKEWQEAKPF